MRVTKNTITLTSTGMQFRWPDHAVIPWTAMEALEIAHQILLRNGELLEMVRQSDRREQKDERQHHEQESIPGSPQPLPPQETN